MKRRPPRRDAHPSTITAIPRHTTVPTHLPPVEAKPPKPARRAHTPKPSPRKTPWGRTTAPKRQVARLIDPEEATLVDVVDNMLSKGVVLNADLILALADVDLVYIRLSALLCAADRVLRPRR